MKQTVGTGYGKWLPRHGKPLEEESRTLLKRLLPSLLFTGACRERHCVILSYDVTGLSSKNTFFFFGTQNKHILNTLDGVNIGQIGAGTISLCFFQNKDIN